MKSKHTNYLKFTACSLKTIIGGKYHRKISKPAALTA